MVSIAIVGKGNVGFHLYNEFLKKDAVRVLQFSSREKVSLENFDIAILAVSDNVIEEVSQHIKSTLVVHTSGTTSINILKNPTNKGVFYPLQSFSKEKPVDFSTLPICLEAQEESDLKLLEDLSSLLGSTYYKVSSEQRKYIHVAAVFANNFTNHMYKLASDILKEQQIPFDILLPLIQETSEKIKNLNPSEAQTGPARRNDSQTIKNHLHLLNDAQHNLYKTLTESIQDHGEKL